MAKCSKWPMKLFLLLFYPWPFGNIRKLKKSRPKKWCFLHVFWKTFKKHLLKIYIKNRLIFKFIFTFRQYGNHWKRWKKDIILDSKNASFLVILVIVRGGILKYLHGLIFHFLMLIMVTEGKFKNDLKISPLFLCPKSYPLFC